MFSKILPRLARRIAVADDLALVVDPDQPE
jgi:hypothetical protein